MKKTAFILFILGLLSQVYGLGLIPDTARAEVVKQTKVFAVLKVTEKNKPVIWRTVSCIDTKSLPQKTADVCIEKTEDEQISAVCYQVSKALVSMKSGYTRKGTTYNLPWFAKKEELVCTATVDMLSYEEACVVGTLFSMYQKSGCMQYKLPKMYEPKKVVIPVMRKGKTKK